MAEIDRHILRGAVSYVNEVLGFHDAQSAKDLHGKNWEQWWDVARPGGILDLQQLTQDSTSSQLLVERVKLLTQQLPPKRRGIFIARHGLEDGQPKSILGIARQLHVTEVYVGKALQNVFYDISHYLKQSSPLIEAVGREEGQRFLVTPIILNALDRDYLASLNPQWEFYCYRHGCLDFLNPTTRR